MDGGSSSKKVRVDLASKPKSAKRRKSSNTTMRAMELMKHMKNQITRKRLAVPTRTNVREARTSSAEDAIAYFNRHGAPSKPSKLGELMSLQSPSDTEGAMEPRFGCLKNGIKPTRRSIHYCAQLDLSGADTARSDSPPHVRLGSPRCASSRSDSPPPVYLGSPGRGARTRTPKRNMKRYHVGRKTGSRTVGVMCYDERTRKRHHRELRQSLPKDTQTMKLDLYNKFILRKGSIAPPGLVREAYESSKIIGDTIGTSNSTDIINAHVRDTIEMY